MKILLQSNIWKEYAYDRLIDSIHNANIEYQEVGLIPFTEDFQEKESIDQQTKSNENRFFNLL